MQLLILKPSFLICLLHWHPITFHCPLTHCIYTVKKNYQGVCEVLLLQGHDAVSLGTWFPVFLRQQCGLIFLDAATVEDTTNVALKLKDLNAQRCCVTSKN